MGMKNGNNKSDDGDTISKKKRGKGEVKTSVDTLAAISSKLKKYNGFARLNSYNNNHLNIVKIKKTIIVIIKKKLFRTSTSTLFPLISFSGIVILFISFKIRNNQQ